MLLQRVLANFSKCEGCAGGIYAVNLKSALRNIGAECGNPHGGWLLSLWRSSTTTQRSSPPMLARGLQIAIRGRRSMAREADQQVRSLAVRHGTVLGTM